MAFQRVFQRREAYLEIWAQSRGGHGTRIEPGGSVAIDGVPVYSREACIELWAQSVDAEHEKYMRRGLWTFRGCASLYREACIERPAEYSHRRGTAHSPSKRLFSSRVSFTATKSTKKNQRRSRKRKKKHPPSECLVHNNGTAVLRGVILSVVQVHSRFRGQPASS